MRVLVTGGAGQLADAVRTYWAGHELIIPEEGDLGLGREETVWRVLSAHRPEVVFNAGAFTQVDRCEAEPDLALRINGTAVGWLAEACNTLDALLVQISTDYVFDGRAGQPRREDDPTGPLSVYGRTKLAGEKNARLAARHLIVRTARLYDAWGRNFLRTMLDAATQGRALRVVDDQWGTPTTCRALARQTRIMVEGGWTGVVHATCAGEATWYRFAAEILRQAGLAADLTPCTTADNPRPAQRPAYSVLDNTRRIALGPDLMPSWEKALEEVIGDLRASGGLPSSTPP